MPRTLRTRAMSRHTFYCWATAIACAATCVAYEAVRINGWFNRFGSTHSNSFFDVAIGQWNAAVIVLYALIFAPLLVVFFNRHRPILRASWVIFSVGMLVITCASVPSAHLGRWTGTSDSFVLFYILAVPIPALVCFVIGLNTQAKAERDGRAL